MYVPPLSLFAAGDEAAIALEAAGGDSDRAVRLLLVLLAPALDAARAALLASSDGYGRDATVAPALDSYVANALAESSCEGSADGGAEEEALALESIYDDAFEATRADGGLQKTSAHCTAEHPLPLAER